MIAPDGRSQVNAIEEEKVLRALVHHGALSFARIHRKVLPHMDLRRCDNVVRRLAHAAQIVTSERGPKIWAITDVGRARLQLPLLGARIGAVSADRDDIHTLPEA